MRWQKIDDFQWELLVGRRREGEEMGEGNFGGTERLGKCRDVVQGCLACLWRGKGLVLQG
jgi:hypothetical protein